MRIRTGSVVVDACRPARLGVVVDAGTDVGVEAEAAAGADTWDCESSWSHQPEGGNVGGGSGRTYRAGRGESVGKGSRVELKRREEKRSASLLGLYAFLCGVSRSRLGGA